MKGLLWTLAASACLAWLPGCGDDSDSTSDTQSPGTEVTPIEELPAAYANALCEAYTACLGPLFSIYLVGEDCAVRTTKRLEDDLPRLQASIAAGRIRYRGEFVSACTKELAGFECDELLERDTASCEQVLDGTLALGAYCAMDEECQGSRYCQFTAACPGTCAELQPEGAQCEADGNCLSGLLCSESSGRCEKPAGPGDLCGAMEGECAAGFACAGADDDENRPGNCRSYDEMFSLASGIACDPIAGKLCESGQVCRIDAAGASGIEATCAAPVAVSAACKLSIPDPCPAEQFCDIPANLLDGTCKPRPVAGETCGRSPFENKGSICAAYTRCDGDTCRALAHLGEACSSDDVCYSEHCVEGVCVASEGCE